MKDLAQQFQSLNLFSDLEWDKVIAEYEGEYVHMTFPEYLQQKAIDGDCPSYLFEIAFFEQALMEARNSDVKFPHQPGTYLNPSTLFLSLEFDIPKMLTEAKKGNPEIIEASQILAVYRDETDQVHTLPLSQDELRILEKMEDGPLSHEEIEEHFKLILHDLTRKKLILSL
jgi:hypothetical protein